MSRSRVKIFASAVAALAGSSDVGKAMVERAQPVLDTAEATAPFRTGGYRDSLRAEPYDSDGRAGARVVAGVDYAIYVEAEHGTLARSLDSVRNT